MVRKTKNRRNLSENRKKNKKRVTRKRRGGNTKGDAEWEKGFWSDQPIIHGRFNTKGKTGKTECEYSLYLDYHYLDEDDSIPLEKTKNGKNKPIKKNEILQIFTDSEATDIKNKTETKNKKYRNCTLTEPEILEDLENNYDFKTKVKNGKIKIEEMVKADRQKKEFIKNMLEYKNEKADDKLKKIDE
jgi:hypothetical protein